MSDFLGAIVEVEEIGETFQSAWLGFLVRECCVGLYLVKGVCEGSLCFGGENMLEVEALRFLVIKALGILRERM